jgi:3D (Asp-Asp-Asp) domain-containing protein
MGFGKQDFYCADVGSAIIGNRLDIWSWYWHTWYDNIKQGIVKNTGKAKIYLSK